MVSPYKKQHALHFMAELLIAFSLLYNFRPGITQADSSVEDRLSVSARIWIAGKIA
jgi:hypothetical protein